MAHKVGQAFDAKGLIGKTSPTQKSPFIGIGYSNQSETTFATDRSPATYQWVPEECQTLNRVESRQPDVVDSFPQLKYPNYTNQFGEIGSRKHSISHRPMHKLNPSVIIIVYSY